MMNRRTFLAGLAIILAWTATARASDPIGGYAVIEKVVLEPNNDAPVRIQIWGTFSLAKEAGGNTYGPPVHGFLYYAAETGKEDTCRKEWADLKKVAGTGQIIGFGSSRNPENMGRVRKANENPESPDVYMVGFGLNKIRAGRDYSPIKELSSQPALTTPGNGDLVPPGTITFVVRNVLDPKHAKATYVFEVESGPDDKQTSDPIPAGEKETKWTPKKEMKSRTKYVWRVWAVDGDWKGPAVSATFQTK
jgi:hypothetical protein